MAARHAMIFILSSPSGAGKTTMAKMILQNIANIVPSISVTTRGQRENEKDGRDYWFWDEQKFREKSAEGAFLEHAKVFDHFYGTLHAPVARQLREGRDVLFDIDWQGARQLRENPICPMVGIFILPPSLAELESRLHRRALDDGKTVARRMEGAKCEMTHWNEYEYVLVNDDISRCYDKIHHIITAERLRKKHYPQMKTALRALLEES